MIISKNLDILLIKFPIIFPIVYGLILYNLPSYEYILVFLTLLLLAEPHFASTWPFFISSFNKDKIYNEKIIYLFGPFLLVITSVILFFVNSDLFYILFFAFNIYHVTRQSSGISRLFIRSKSEESFSILIIYLFGVFYFILEF